MAFREEFHGWKNSCAYKTFINEVRAHEILFSLTCSEDHLTVQILCHFPTVTFSLTTRAFFYQKVNAPNPEISSLFESSFCRPFPGIWHRDESSPSCSPLQFLWGLKAAFPKCHLVTTKDDHGDWAKDRGGFIYPWKRTTYKTFSRMGKVWICCCAMSSPKVNLFQVKTVPKYHLQNLRQGFSCIRNSPAYHWALMFTWRKMTSLFPLYKSPTTLMVED